MVKRLINYMIAILLTLCSVAVIGAAFLYYFIATPAGVRALVNYAVLQSAPYAAVNIDSSSGTFQRGLILKNVSIKNWPQLGQGASLLIQRVDIRIPPWRWDNIQVNLFNGRLNLPNCDVILFNGKYADGIMQGTAFSHSLDVAVIMKPFLTAEVMRVLRGQVSDANLTLQGTLSDPRIKGHFYVDRIQYTTTIVREGLARYDLSFMEQDGVWHMNGPLVLESGLVNVRRSTIELRQSRASFKGDVKDPELAVYGTAKADIYTIDLKISGTLERPVTQLHSEPSLSDEMARMVLGMGNWAPSNLSLQYDNDNKKFGLQKKLSDELKLGVEWEQLPARVGQQAEYSNTVQGELSLTEKFSFNVAEKLFSQGQNTTTTSPNVSRRQDESEFLLKYKNTF